MDRIIEELKSAHDSHIQKLNQLHCDALASLHDQLARSRQQIDMLTRQNALLEEEVEGMRTEVQMLRGSYEMVRERLRRVLVDQDDLVKMFKLIENVNSVNSVNSESLNSARVNSNSSINNGSSVNSSSNVNSNIYSNGNSTNNQSNNKNTHNTHNHTITTAHTSTIVADIENELKRREQDPSTVASLQALKYFKKLDSSDPLHLCRLLEIPFTPDRAFALSSSLLASIALHLTTATAFEGQPVFPLLLEEIVRLRREGNELCKAVLGATSRRGKEVMAEIEKSLREDKKSIAKLLIEGQTTTIPATNENIFSSLLSKFGI